MEKQELKEYIGKLAALKSVVFDEYKRAIDAYQKDGFIDPGESQKSMLPNGEVMATIIAQRNKRTVDVFDEDVLVQWAQENMPVHCEWYVPEGNMASVLDLVHNHAPGLLGVRLRSNAMKQIEQIALDGENIPGIAVVEKPGSVSARVEKSVKLRMLDNLRAGEVTVFKNLELE